MVSTALFIVKELVDSKLIRCKILLYDIRINIYSRSFTSTDDNVSQNEMEPKNLITVKPSYDGHQGTGWSEEHYNWG